MADRSSTEQQNNQQDQSNQSGQSSQPQIDSAFFEQMAAQTGHPTGFSPSSLGYDITSTVVQSYFEQIEAQTRQARRMADLWAQSLILQQTHSQIVNAVVPLAARQTVEYLRRNPQVAQDVLSQTSR
jgi:hypothetical protein